VRAVRRVLGIAAFVGLLAVGWRFAAEHPQPVRIRYLVGETGDVALWVALLGAFAAGAVLVGALAIYQLVRVGMLARRYRKLAAKLEVEVHELRNLPLAPEPPQADLDVGPGTALGHALERGS
jgi:uncharacterized integral membrane protein